MATHNYLHIGTREHWGIRPVGFTDHDAFQHTWINGATGTGKSELLKSLHSQIVQHGHGCTLIDLNGDISRESLSAIPPELRRKVIFVDPTDTEHVLPINHFYQVPTDKHALHTDNFLGACEAIWTDGWGDRMEWYLRNIHRATLQAPEELRPTLLSIPLMISRRPHYRRAVLKHITDPQILAFFEDEFNELTPTKLKEVIMPIENKIGEIISHPLVKNMLSPYKPAFQFKDAIADKSIVIVRLPKGTLGETAAKLLGSMIVSTILNAAQEQDALDPKDRIPHYLLIDEKHILPTTALTSAYAEMRKYKLGIIVTTQYTDQMPADEVNSMLGNIGTIIALRSSALDADRFYKQIGHIKPHQYTDLKRGEAIARLLFKGTPAHPKRMNIAIKHDYAAQYNQTEKIIDFTRNRYARPRVEVEATYMQWLRKMTIDPAERTKRRKSANQSRAKKEKVVFSHELAAKSPKVSSRGKNARAAIKKIVDDAAKKHASTQPRIPVYKMPTRRRQRRNYPSNN